MAPEVQNVIESGVAGSDYTNAVDMWAAGCITYRLVTGVVPFPPGRTLIKYCEDKSLFPYDALFDSGIKSACSKFIRHLLVVQPQERPSATLALQHEWIGVSKHIHFHSSIAFKLSFLEA
jgi:calcium/calmodulin-dependent protein kinase I